MCSDAAAWQVLVTDRVLAHVEERVASGLVGDVQPKGFSRPVRVHDVLAATMKFAKKLAAKPPLSVQMMKRLVKQSAEADLRTALDLTSSHIALAYSLEDTREAFEAIRDRRKPEFKGR